MARIVYGISGEGSGHSSRAREIATHLIEQGHTVRLASYDRGYRNLKDDFDVLQIEGLSIRSVDNRVSVVKTFTDNIKRLSDGFKSLQQLRQELFKSFQPHCVLTDFEPMTAYLANHYSLPLITVDNQHRMRYVSFDCPPGLQSDAQLVKNIIRLMVPRPDVSLITTFREGKPKNERTFQFPPILRREVLAQPSSSGTHILVYLTGGYESFMKELEAFPREHFVIYGYDQSKVLGNLTFKPFSKDGFLEDLASSKAVMATAGFTLISEALFLRKPLLALPMQGQFEQELNAYQLEQAGYGLRVVEDFPMAIGAFLYRLPELAERLADYEPAGNDKICQKLDELLADDGREIVTRR
jgi:uncharacterized protein (TIGR00661 family)